jgi:hypothetical protein
VWREDEVPDFLPNASDQGQLFEFYTIPLFFLSPLSCTSAMPFNLRSCLSTISRVPAEGRESPVAVTLCSGVTDDSVLHRKQKRRLFGVLLLQARCDLLSGIQGVGPSSRSWNLPVRFAESPRWETAPFCDSPCYTASTSSAGKRIWKSCGTNGSHRNFGRTTIWFMNFTRR